MQRLGAKALVWGALALLSAGAVGGTGCTAKKPTELVPGVSTQMVVSRDLAGISVEVVGNGQRVFCQGYTVSPSTNVVNLPSTLGVLPAHSAETVVKITIRGYDAKSIMGSDFNNCEGAAVASGPVPVATPTANAPRVLRRSIQTYVDQHELFLPLPLSYACIDKDCSTAGPDFSCKANTCVDSTTDTATLVDFDPTLLDGTGLCFSPMQCFPPGVTFPAIPIDTDKCIYGLPSFVTDASIASGMNARVFYQDWTWAENQHITGKPFEQVEANAGELEILNADPPNCGDKGAPACEGFKVLGATSDAGASGAEATAEASFSPADGGDAGSLIYNPSALRIQLAPGLCDLVHASQTPPPKPATGNTLTYHTISDISISGVCQPKLPLLPICAAERNNNPILPDAGTTGDGVCNVAVPLIPAPSALYLVMDNTSVMHGALGVGGSVSQLAKSFTDPVFQQTYAGFKYVTGLDSECTLAAGQPTGYTQPLVPACAQGAICKFQPLRSLQSQVDMAIGSWTPPPSEPPGMMCYADVDCPSTAPFCYKPNPSLPEGGLSEGGGDAGDGGLVQGNCVNPQPLDLQAAMRLNEGAYSAVEAAIQGLATPGVAGVMFFVNRMPQTALGSTASDGGATDGGVGDGGTADGGPAPIPPFPAPIAAKDCPVPPPGVSITTPTPPDVATVPAEALAAQQAIESEARSAFAQGLQTYFVVLGSDRTTDQNAINFFTQVDNDLLQPSGARPVITLDATHFSTTLLEMGDTTAVNEAQAFSDAIARLGTCLYEIPQTIPATTPPSSIQVGFTDPKTPLTQTTVPYNPNCTSVTALGDAGTTDGWAFDTGRVRICGASCTNLRTAVNHATTYNLTQPPASQIDVKVLITPLCTGTSGSSDATMSGG